MCVFVALVLFCEARCADLRRYWYHPVEMTAVIIIIVVVVVTV